MHIMKPRSVKGKYVYCVEMVAHLSNAVHLLRCAVTPFDSSLFTE